MLNGIYTKKIETENESKIQNCPKGYTFHFI